MEKLVSVAPVIPSVADLGLDGLNPAQREAVLAPDGPLLILAGAGTGKTRVLTHRIAHLVASGRARPNEICAVTFTNKATREMRDRLDHLLLGNTRGMFVGTYHRLGLYMLRQGDHAQRVGRKPGFTILDPADTKPIVVRICANIEFEPSPKTKTIGDIIDTIGWAKDSLISPDDLALQAQTDAEASVATIYAAYEERLLQANAVDLDDLIRLPCLILEDHPDVLDRYQDRYRHYLVDEYQDTSMAQYRLMALLAGRERNLSVVGDDDQAIYGWRHADIRNILSFQAEYPDARSVKLERNYRSHQGILDVAHAVVVHNEGRMEKRLWSERKEGAPTYLIHASDETQEANAVCGEIQRLHTLLDEQGQSRHPYSEMALLFRINAQARALEEACIRWRIPYRIARGIRFYGRAEIKDALSYLQLLANPSDTIAFERAIKSPRRGVGEKTVAQLAEDAAQLGVPILDAVRTCATGPGRAAQELRNFGQMMEGYRELAGHLGVHELLAKILDETGYLASMRAEGDKPRLENLDELVGLCGEYAAMPGWDGLTTFLENAALMSAVDEVDAVKGDAVTLITAHMAKGLEFSVVFLTGMEESVFPYRRSVGSDEATNEERRLAYVGITRAKDRFYVSHADRRHLFGRSEDLIRSRFIGEMPEHLLRPFPMSDEVQRSSWAPTPRVARPLPRLGGSALGF
jgi:DNA helicase-2/ATP-dependent DNA helicase PcrA